MFPAFAAKAPQAAVPAAAAAAAQRLTEQQRPAGTNNLFVAWETLTHAGNPP
ncbi:hypothetical protein [Streptomyces xantholiticus]|uniref:Uncharacterized protein n=1 Tax=Streptomyces xantholiticus TaxID=68285 RepID=A0ABV1UPP1_9ACTN